LPCLLIKVPLLSFLFTWNYNDKSQEFKQPFDKALLKGQQVVEENVPSSPMSTGNTNLPTMLKKI
jgi:hypothetical protein